MNVAAHPMNLGMFAVHFKPAQAGHVTGTLPAPVPAPGFMMENWGWGSDIVFIRLGSYCAADSADVLIGVTTPLDKIYR